VKAGTLTVFALLTLLLGCGSAIVGAECRPGYVLCDGRCVDTENDPDHCGRCGRDCGRDECNAGMCGPDDPEAGVDGGPADAGAADASIEGGGGRPPGQNQGSSGTPFLPDGGFNFPDPNVMSGCGIGQTDCSGRCVDLQSDHDQCGACTTACGSEQFCAAGVCVDTCEAPLRPCGGACVDFQQDGYNCGGCGRVCASGLCRDGECTDAVAGSVVVIGHDYSTAASLTMQRVAGNALFLAPGAPVRALVYAGMAAPASVSGVTAAVESIVRADGRDWTETAATDPEQVGAQLAGVDAFLIHAQQGATDAVLDELGERWGLSMAQFLLRGGVIVLFETQSSDNGGTFRILQPAGLFSCASREAIAAQTLFVDLAALGSGVATRLTRDYRGQDTTVRFLDPDLDGLATVVVRDGDDEAVVVHRVVVP